MWITGNILYDLLIFLLIYIFLIFISTYKILKSIYTIFIFGGISLTFGLFYYIYSDYSDKNLGIFLFGLGMIFVIISAVLMRKKFSETNKNIRYMSALNICGSSCLFIFTYLYFIEKNILYAIISIISLLISTIGIIFFWRTDNG